MIIEIDSKWYDKENHLSEAMTEVNSYQSPEWVCKRKVKIG